MTALHDAYAAPLGYDPRQYFGHVTSADTEPTVCRCGEPIWIKKTGECRRCYRKRWEAEHPRTRLSYTTNLGRYPLPLNMRPTTYAGAHSRVKRYRGTASEHTCPCGAPAQEWSYRGDSPHEQSGEVVLSNGKRKHLAWSPYVYDYDALCIPCHIARDRPKD